MRSTAKETTSWASNCGTPRPAPRDASRGAGIPHPRSRVEFDTPRAERSPDRTRKCIANRKYMTRARGADARYGACALSGALGLTHVTRHECTIHKYQMQNGIRNSDARWCLLNRTTACKTLPQSSVSVTAHITVCTPRRHHLSGPGVRADAYDAF